MPTALHSQDLILQAIANLRGKDGLHPEADTLLKLAAQTAQGKTLEQCVADLKIRITPLSVNASTSGHPLAWMHFIQWMSLCSESAEMRAEFDRLRGTNVSRHGTPMDVTIDDATGKFEADARAFFEFCFDMYQRLPSNEKGQR